MKTVAVSLDDTPGRDYVIQIGAGLLGKIGSLYDLGSYSKLFIVRDGSVGHLLEELVVSLPSAASVVLPTGENNKRVDSVQRIWTAMHQAGCDRKSLVINLGGGIVCDLGGFAAATYMRGVDFLNIPTTLLSQVDASVGGKTGFNFDGVKNLVGTFDQPIGVVIDPQVLQGLPDRELASGFAEIIKHGLIADKGYFEQVTAKRPREFTPGELEDIIAGSCRIKQKIVQKDVKEDGARKLLNFGHTVGHALEALSLETGRPLLHGEAVGLGMLAEARISERLGRLSSADAKLIEGSLNNAGLPTVIPGQDMQNIFDKMRSDKKNEAGTINFTLLSGIGQADYNQTADVQTVEKAILTILKP